MWHIADFQAGLVGRCEDCYGTYPHNEKKLRVAEVYAQPEEHRCPSCFGTTFEGGWKAQIIRPCIFSDADEDEQKQARGIMRPQDLSVESTTDFRVRTGDYVVRGTGDRFQLRVPQRVTLRTGFAIPHQTTAAIGYNHARASLEDPTSVVYIIAPPREQLDQVLSMAARFPIDFSAYETIKAPLVPIGDD